MDDQHNNLKFCSYAQKSLKKSAKTAFSKTLTEDIKQNQPHKI